MNEQMKILLAACNAKYIHSNLAIFNLKAYAKEYGDNVVLREYTINQLKDDILKDIYRCHPDVVCVSCYIWNITFVRELMQDLRKILPESECERKKERLCFCLRKTESLFIFLTKSDCEQ